MPEKIIPCWMPLQVVSDTISFLNGPNWSHHDNYIEQIKGSYTNEDFYFSFLVMHNQSILPS
jgi:hypothetical protein